MLNILAALIRFVGRIILYMILAIVHLLETVVLIICGIGHSLGSFYILLLIISLLIDDSIQNFVLQGTWIQIGIKMLFVISPVLLTTVIPEVVLGILEELQNFIIDRVY